MKKIKGFMMVLVIAMLLVISSGTQKAEAASKYIKVEDFIKYIVEQMGWAIDRNSDQPYIDKAIDTGILKKNDFKDYTAYLTRTDAAVIANRLDEYINQKYGYPQDVYEFLRDCNLFEGRLYYDIKGKFFPEGETDQTYKAQNFSVDVATQLFDKVFPNDEWVNKGLRTRYKDVYDDNNVITKTFIMIGMVSSDKTNEVRIEPFNENADIIKAWNIIKDDDRQLSAVLEHRISDISSIPKAKRETVASIVAKGIIKGYSNGMYVQNREFRGKNKITAKGAKDVIQMVLNPEKRAQVSPDGQLIRTTKLPKNASDYKYILECFPNKYYEMKYRFMYLDGFYDGAVDKSSYNYPKNVDYDFLFNRYYNNQLKLDMDKYEYYDAAIIKLDRYLQHIFNVDYRTVDDKWKEGLASSFSSFNVDWRLDLWIDNYIKAMKNNEVVVESKLIAIEPGTLYDSTRDLYVRVYVKYKVTAKNVKGNQDGIVFGDYTTLTNLRSGEWREGVYDIEISNRYTMEGIYQWGVDTMSYITDWVYEDSFK